MRRCCSRETHISGMISANASQIYFEAQGMLPVPWYLMLTDYERHIMKLFDLGCTACLELTFPRPTFICGLSCWQLHCHCKNPGSLFCIAGAAWITKFVTEYLRGCSYNGYFPHYRASVNRGLPCYVHYVGSVYYKTLHFIYLEFASTWDVELCMDKLSFGNGMIVYGPKTYLIIVCKSCSPLSEIVASCCMRRTRKLLTRCLNVMRSFMGHRFCGANVREQIRNRHFERYWRYGLPIAMKYMN